MSLFVDNGDWQGGEPLNNNSFNEQVAEMDEQEKILLKEMDAYISVTAEPAADDIPSDYSDNDGLDAV